MREENFETPEEILEEKEKDCAEKEKEDFSEIENAQSQNAQLIMMRMGWNVYDYGNAVSEFKMTCSSEGVVHDNNNTIQKHFGYWTLKRYKYGERPLSGCLSPPNPQNSNDFAFNDFYRSKFNTGFVWQAETSDDIQKLADAISSKISESGNSVIPSEMPSNITAFLSKAWSLGDTWLQEHFTPKNIANQFNVIYGYIKSGKKPSAGTGRGKQNNTTGVPDEYLEKLQRDLYSGFQPK